MVYTVSTKTVPLHTLVHNFDRCLPIFKIISLLYSPINLQQNPCHNAHRTLDV